MTRSAMDADKTRERPQGTRVGSEEIAIKLGAGCARGMRCEDAARHGYSRSLHEESQVSAGSPFVGLLVFCECLILVDDTNFQRTRGT